MRQKRGCKACLSAGRGGSDSRALADAAPIRLSRGARRSEQWSVAAIGVCTYPIPSFPTYLPPPVGHHRLPPPAPARRNSRPPNSSTLPARLLFSSLGLCSALALSLSLSLSAAPEQAAHATKLRSRLPSHRMHYQALQPLHPSSSTVVSIESRERFLTRSDQSATDRLCFADPGGQAAKKTQINFQYT